MARSERLPALLASAIVWAVPVSAGAATIGDLSAKLRPGMWEVRSTGNVFTFDPSGKLTEQTRVFHSCMTEKMRAESLKQITDGAKAGSGCKIRSEKVSGETFEVIIDCVSKEFGDSRMRMTGTVRPEYQRVETTLTFASPPPALGGVKEMKDVAESKWLRACRADEKPGRQPDKPRP